MTQPTAASQVVQANNGWSVLQHVLQTVQPASLKQSQAARRGIRHLIATGR